MRDHRRPGSAGHTPLAPFDAVIAGTRGRRIDCSHLITHRHIPTLSGS